MQRNSPLWDIYETRANNRVWTKRACGVGHGLGHSVGLAYLMAYPMAHPLAYWWSFIFKTRLIAINLCKQCAPFCPLGGVSLKFSKQTHGRWESAKPECRVNATFRQLSHERAIILILIFDPKWRFCKGYRLCMMGDFQNRLISRIFRVSSSGFLRRTTVKLLVE